MKKAEFLFAITLSLLCMVDFTGCKNNEVTPPDPGVPPSEHVVGYITDEAGNPLENIQIDAYLNEELTQSYYGEYLTPPHFYTDTDGYYSFGQASEYGYYLARELPPIKDVYVVASDTACVYKTQVHHVQMIYRKEYGYVVEVRLDIQMEK